MTRPRTVPEGFDPGMPWHVIAPNRAVEWLHPERDVPAGTEREPHPVHREDLDAAALQVELARLLGRDVAVNLRTPTPDRAGLLRVYDPATGVELEVDPDTVAAAVDGAEPDETARQRFLREDAAATTPAARMSAFRSYMLAEEEEAQRIEHRRRRAKEKMAAARREGRLTMTEPIIPARRRPRGGMELA